MLETYFAAPKTLERLRAGPSGPYMDGYAASLKRDGYRAATAVRYLRAPAHLGHFLQGRGGTLANIDLSAFFQHLRTCRCPRSKGGRRNHHTSFGAKRYRDYLVQIGVCRCGVMPEIRCADPALVVDFRWWLQKHRGAAEPTVRLYSGGATELLLALGDNPTRWNAEGVRAHFLERTARCGVGTAEKLVTSLRAFLRYLSVHGWCRADLDQAVPAFTSWRLADLPKYLTAEQVDRLIAGCDGRSPERRRDRAIIMLLARLGLRAGDVARLRIADIEWETGTLRVAGKGRYQVRLPLPQDVGDESSTISSAAPGSATATTSSFETAPFRSFAHGDGVSSVVKRAMKRAGIVTPAKGAHVLRHTAATEMLRHGVPLDRIALVLRHRGVDTTAYYAKADVNSLKQIAQPWPEALP